MPEGLTRKIGVVAFARGATAASIFAVNAILTRTWSADDFGQFSTIWVFGNTLVPVFLLGLPTGLLYFFPKRTETDKPALMTQVAVCLLVSGLALSGFLWMINTWLPDEHSFGAAGFQQFGRHIIPFIPYLATVVAAGYAESALVAAGKTTWQAILSLTTAIVVVATAALTAFDEWSIDGFLWGVSLVGIIRLVFSVILVAEAVGFGWSVGPEFLQLVRYSIQIGLNDAVGSLSRSVDRVVVFLSFSASAFGIYHIGAIEIPINLVLGAVITVLIPEISKKYVEGDLTGIAILWKQAVGGLALLVIPLFCFLFTFANDIITLYVPGSYSDSQWVFRIFLLILPLRCAIYNPLLVGIGKAHWAMWGGVGDLLMNLILSVGFVYAFNLYIPAWALLGPAIATVISTYLQIALLVLFIGRHLKWRVRDLLPWQRFLRIGFLSAAVSLITIEIVHLIDLPEVSFAIGGSVFAVFFFAALLLHPLERQEAVSLIRSLFNP